MTSLVVYRYRVRGTQPVQVCSDIGHRLYARVLNDGATRVHLGADPGVEPFVRLQPGEIHMHHGQALWALSPGLGSTVVVEEVYAQ